MKIVSENSKADLARKAAKEDVEHCLRELAANILRCCAGGGKGDLIEQQCQEFSRAKRRYDIAFGGSMPLGAHHILAASTSLKHYRDWVSDASASDCSIRDAAMQIQAGYLLDQMTQVSNAEGKLRTALSEKGYKRVKFDE